MPTKRKLIEIYSAEQIGDRVLSMKISQKLFNSIVAILALIIAGFSAWQQVRTVPDRLILTGGMRISVDKFIETKEIYNLDTNAFDFAIGPISWDFKVYNPTTKPISITQFSPTYITQNSRYVMYSNLVFEISDSSDINEPVSEVETIGQNEAKSYVLKGFVPIQSNRQQKENCLKIKHTLIGLESCFADYGSDLFGRELRKEIRKDNGDLVVTTLSIVNYEHRNQILLTIVLGDGNEEALELSY